MNFVFHILHWLALEGILAFDLSCLIENQKSSRRTDGSRIGRVDGLHAPGDVYDPDEFDEFEFGMLWIW